MNRLVVATGNAGKLREIRALFPAEPIEWLGLETLPAVAFPDEGAEYRANALAKARAVAEQLGEAAVADDSGLEVEALGGRPGPHSARYGGPGLDDAGRVGRLLAELADIEPGRRTARFVCHAALALPDGRSASVVGVCDGIILAAPTGRAGFGYDPVFQARGEVCAMAELSAARKNQISHRARAFALLAQTSIWGSWLST